MVRTHTHTHQTDIHKDRKEGKPYCFIKQDPLCSVCEMRINQTKRVCVWILVCVDQCIIDTTSKTSNKHHHTKIKSKEKRLFKIWGITRCDES